MMMSSPRARLTAATVTLVAICSAVPRMQAPARAPDPPDADTFFQAAAPDEAASAPALARIAEHWEDGHASMLLDLIDLLRRTSLVNPLEWLRLARLVGFLEQQTGQAFGVDIGAWRQWVWSRPYRPHPEYAALKARLYGQLDPGFEAFFQAPLQSEIRLDEVQWGGVAVNGIPPLDHPAHVDAASAAYLDDGNIVFGISVDGESRAYPKRILAWHELARDRIADRELTVVYCTLCGTVIPYESRVGGKVRTFGTSGLLYQSNKLMFDEETRSLWSSLEGTPVIGPLVGSGLRLSLLPVVTTTWGEWRRAHPDTTVLSLDTGHARDYSGGAAYRTYFASDALMFGVSRMDGRLANKAEILALRLTGASGTPEPPVAIAADFLREHPVYHVEAASPPLVVVTTAGGANRVYQSGLHQFVRLDDAGRVRDAVRQWTSPSSTRKRPTTALRGSFRTVATFSSPPGATIPGLGPCTSLRSTRPNASD